MAQRRGEFEQQNAQILVIVSHDMFRIRQWNHDPRLPFPVLADGLAATAARYGVAWRILLHYEWVNRPTVFVVDKEGLVRYAHVGMAYNDRAPADEVLAALRNLSAAEAAGP